MNGELKFELHEYLDSDGKFDYDRYKVVQTEGNLRKINSVWVRESNIEFISEYLRPLLGIKPFGICHGTRRGKEQEWFKKYLNCDAIGTEISESASQFPDTIEWDFHDVKDEWINSIDFIYSNSFDHSFDPEKCLNAWISCLKNEGVCILEHTSAHEVSSELDPFGAKLSQILALINVWGKGCYKVKEVLDAPVMPDVLQYSKFIVIDKV